MNFNSQNYKISPLLLNEEIIKNPQKFSRLLIEISPHYQDKLEQILSKYQGKIIRELNIIPSVVVEVPNEAIKELMNIFFIKKIWGDVTTKALLDVAVPTVGGDLAYQREIKGSGIVVGVIDTGIYPHDDLTKPTNRILGWMDLVNQKNYPYDDNGHGTHIAGIIAGNGYSSGGKYTGMAPNSKLVGIKVLDKEGSGSLSNVLAAIEWCINNIKTLKIQVLNLSLGAVPQESYRTDPLCRATTEAWKNGIVVCCAAGNEGPKLGTITSPGINPRVITVGNIDDQNTISSDDDRLHWSSSKGPTFDHFVKPDLVAPGTKIISLANNKNGYQTLTGTSMATGFVSGAAALILEQWKDYSPDVIKRLLLNNAKDLGLGPNLQGAGELSLEPIFREKRNRTTESQREIITKMLGYILSNSTNLKASEFGRDLDRVIHNTISNLIRKNN